MKKEEFINNLDISLNKMDEKDKRKVLKKYRTIFTKKQNNGLSDEQIIEEFGNFNELVKSILKEYNVDTPAVVSAGIIALFLKELLDTIQLIVRRYQKSNYRQKLSLCLEILIILLVLALFKFPFILLRDFGATMLGYVISPIGIILNCFWRLFVEITYLVICIYIFSKTGNYMFKPKYKKAK